MKINPKWLTIFSIGYIYTPIMIFFLTWTKTYIALLCIAVSSICFFRMMKNNDESEEVVKVDWLILILAILFFIWIGYYAGWGRFVDQTLDWEKHNAVLFDLVQRGWPVIYENNGERSMLTYYIGQYIVPGAVGKALHSTRIAELTLYLWNEIGLVLVFLNIIVYAKLNTYIKQFFCALMLPFFSLPVWLSKFMLNRLELHNSFYSEDWVYYSDSIKLQYTHNFSLFRYVSPQTITIWLIIIVFLLHRDKINYYVFLLLPSMMFSLFAFIGLLPLAFGSALEKLLKTKQLKEWLLKMVSPENILMILTHGIVFLIYYWGNVMSEKPASIGFMVTPYDKASPIIYFCFVCPSLLPYAAILWKTHKTDGVYAASIVTLVALPLFQMGLYNDLLMRASIPALFILMIDIIHFFDNNISGNAKYVSEKISLISAILLLLLGMYYSFHGLSDAVEGEYYDRIGRQTTWNSLEEFANRTLDVDIDFKYNYFSYDIDDNFFLKYIGK